MITHLPVIGSFLNSGKFPPNSLNCEPELFGRHKTFSCRFSFGAASENEGDFSRQGKGKVRFCPCLDPAGTPLRPFHAENTPERQGPSRNASLMICKHGSLDPWTLTMS